MPPFLTAELAKQLNDFLVSFAFQVGIIVFVGARQSTLGNVHRVGGIGASFHQDRDDPLLAPDDRASERGRTVVLVEVFDVGAVVQKPLNPLR